MNSEFLESIQKQFLYYKMLGEKAINQVNGEEQLNWTPNEESNSIAVIVKHLHGNMLSRWTDFLTSDGEKEWRNRDGEFENDISGKASILKIWEEGWACLMQTLKNLKPEELFQSINPFFVIILTPVVIFFFSYMRRKGKEPSTPAKMTYGLVISALSTLVMVWAVSQSNNGLDKSSGWWLVATYGIITFGELCLSPMGLSLVSKVSPPRIAALMMGAWSLSTSIGNKLSGVLASLWDGYDNKMYFFLLNFGLLMVAALGIFIMLPWLRRIINEHTKT